MSKCNATDNSGCFLWGKRAAIIRRYPPPLPPPPPPTHPSNLLFVLIVRFCKLSVTSGFFLWGFWWIFHHTRVSPQIPELKTDPEFPLGGTRFDWEFAFCVRRRRPALSCVPSGPSSRANRSAVARGEVPQTGLSCKHGAQCIAVQCRKRKDNRGD